MLYDGFGIGINKSTAAYYFYRLREIIACQIEQELHEVSGGEIDESYFGDYRKGNHGRGAGGKMAVFGLLKRGGKVVYTKIIQDAHGAICHADYRAYKSAG